MMFRNCDLNVLDFVRYVLSELNRRDLLKKIPDNLALEGLAEGMIEAWKLYNKAKYEPPYF